MNGPAEHDERKIDLSVWRELLGFLRPYRRAVIVLVVCGVTVAGVDAAFALVTRRVIDTAFARRSLAAAAPWLWVYGGLAAVLVLGIGTFIRMAGTIRTGVAHDIREAGFARLQELSYSFYDHHPVGWLMARMTSDCDRLSNVFAWGILDLAWGTMLLTLISIVMLVIDWKLALLVLAVMPVVFWVSAFFRKRILASARIVRKTNSKITAAYNEGLMGAATTKSFAREDAEHVDFRGLTGEMYGASVRNAILSAFFLPIVLSLGSIATGAALVAGGRAVAVGGITVGTLFLFVTYSRQFFEPIQELAAWLAEMQTAQAAAERILGLVRTVPEIRDGPDVIPGAAPDGFATIELRGVGFAYGDGPKVIDGIDLVVRAGETIALVGPTGAGKTTLVNLLCRFYEPTEGEILFDGVDYRKRTLAWLQGNLGVVLQDPHLFSGTIGDNIRYGKLDATDEEVVAAAKLAGAHDFVMETERGYAAEVGEGGARLSTGQKQLLSFARAILKRPRILVMDEATSSVDTETEKRIQRAMRHVLEGRTSFVIAHRLSTIRDADRILVIEDGRIVESGSHAELMRTRGRYAKLYGQQSLTETVHSGLGWEN